MTEKRYRIKTACPQCGCSGITDLSREEILLRYGDVPNVELECSECMIRFTKKMKDACPEWDEECRLEKESDG